MDNVTLKDLKLVKDQNRRGYALEATYIIENDSGIYEAKIDGVRLPVNPSYCMMASSLSSDAYWERSIDIGYGDQPFDSYTVTTLEEKVKEITMADIEKKFGCKVKIVR